MKKQPFHPTLQQFLTDGAFAILFGALIGLFVLFNSARYGDVFPLLSADYIRQPWIIVLNVLPTVLVSLAFWLLAGRLWLSSLITALVLLVMSYGNYFKIYYRGDPFVAADIASLREAQSISSRYPLFLTRWMIAQLVCVAVLVAFFVWRDVRRRRSQSAASGEDASGKVAADANGEEANVPLKRVLKPLPKARRLLLRGALLVLVVCLALFLVFPFYNDDRSYALTDLSNENYLERFNPADQFLAHGFTFSFLRSAYRSIERPQEGYSEQLARDILGRFTDADIPEDKKIDVIAVMLEAFADLSAYDEIAFADEVDVYEVWRRISEEGISGRLVTNVFAAGTINSERNFLTGFDTTNASYYNEATSFVRYFKSQGYTVTGAHPGENWFYNRENINKWLGFDSYYFLQNRYRGMEVGSIVPDAYFLPDVWTLYEQRDRSKPYFSFNVTYQNHAPYSDTYTPAVRYLRETQFAGEEDEAALRNILSNYLNGIYQTNVAIGAFVDKARASEDPIALVFFGDHKPWLGGGNSVYEALGINIDLGTAEGMLNYYSTSYVIWMNDAAKAVLGEGLTEEEKAARFSGDGGDTSPCFLMTKLFDAAGWKGPAFMQLERAFMREEAIAVNRETWFYVLADGSFAQYPDDEVYAREQEILYAQYYLKHKNIYGK